MALYKIIRVYGVPGKNRIEATNRMMEALALGVDSDFHMMDYIKEPENPTDKGSKVNLTPPKGWVIAFLDQLMGRVDTKR